MEDQDDAFTGEGKLGAVTTGDTEMANLGASGRGLVIPASGQQPRKRKESMNYEAISQMSKGSSLSVFSKNDMYMNLAVDIGRSRAQQ